MRRVALLVTSTVLVLALAAPAAGAHDDHPGPGHPGWGAATQLRPLHVDPVARAIVDDRDRQVTLRGVNVNSLGDYYQGNPALPTVVPVTGADWDSMAAHGFDVVRLLVSWSRLEPRAGVIDRGYLREVARAVDAAAARGIYSVIDMHQDAWGKYIATPPGTRCAPGTSPAIGWDGAPQWATLTDGADTCRGGSREDSPAVRAAWDSFYTDRAGIQSHLVHVWDVIARRFADDPAVAGYDTINEPNHGNRSDYADRLAAYDGRAIAAIRAGEQRAAMRGERSFSHPVFFETTVFGVGPTAGFTTDTNLVFEGHNYAESIDNLPIEGLFDYFQSLANRYGAPLWIGEYGWFSDPVANQSKLARYAAKEDALVTAGDAWWQWRQACGDPHSIGTIGGTPSTVLVHFQVNLCPGDRNLGVVPQWSCTWRAYPRAVPGRLTQRVSACAGPLDLAGSTPRPGVADVWFPGPTAPTVTGAWGPVHRNRVPGGWRVSFVVAGTYRVHVAA